jgi:hypothetical protein
MSKVEFNNETQEYLASVKPKQLIKDYIISRGFEISNDVDDLPTNPTFIKIVKDLKKLVKVAEVRPDLD